MVGAEGVAGACAGPRQTTRPPERGPSMARPSGAHLGSGCCRHLSGTPACDPPGPEPLPAEGVSWPLPRGGEVCLERNVCLHPSTEIYFSSLTITAYCEFHLGYKRDSFSHPNKAVVKRTVWCSLWTGQVGRAGQLGVAQPGREGACCHGHPRFEPLDGGASPSFLRPDPDW